MDYLTAVEASEKWGISSRMVAYYCEAGRINGAIKKGKTWLIPLDAKKPIDKRYSMQKPKDNTSLQEELYHFREEDIGQTYHVSDVYNNLGLTRETLRYYEKIGLIKPKRSRYSQYREFDLYDMSHLMAIDFFKKRGFNPGELIKLLGVTAPEEYMEIMQQQAELLQRNIEAWNEMLKRLIETKNLYSNALDSIGKFSVRELSPYYIYDIISSVGSFEEYKDKVLSYLNLESEDILSSMVRAVTFDEKGYKASGIYIVEPVTEPEQADKRGILEYGKCLYTTLIADEREESIMERMYDLCYKWAKEHEMSFRGVVYIFVRFVMMGEQTNYHCYEVWVPLK